MLFIITFYIFFIQPLLEARAEIKKNTFIQMKTLKFAFEIDWPLETLGC